MKKLLLGLLLSLLLITQSYAATGWVKTKPLGTENPSALDTTIGENNSALDLMLSNYRRGCIISYASAATLTVGIGELAVSNSAGNVRLFLANTSATTVAWTNIDTGSEEVSTTYYVYAIASATTDTTFTVKISKSSTTPTGVTYYRRLGSFYNDANSNITLINNDDDDKELGDLTTKTNDVVYQASTDGEVIAHAGIGGSAELSGCTDSSSDPTTCPCAFGPATGSIGGGFTMPVKKGDHWKVTASGLGHTIYWIPKQ